MTTLYVFTVKDNATGDHGAPFSVVHPQLANRHFGDECTQPNGAFTKHRKDFDLYALGTYETSTATFNPTAPQMIARGSDFDQA